MTDLASPALAAPARVSRSLVYAAAALAAVVVVALAFAFGFAFVILFADFAALTGVAAIVALTALDLVRGLKAEKR